MIALALPERLGGWPAVPTFREGGVDLLATVWFGLCGPAGVPVDWLRDKGVVVRNLSTSFGPLSYSLGMRGDEVALRIESGLRLPAGGVVVRAPTPWPIGKVVLDGATVSPGPAGEIVLRNLPATLVLRR